MSAITPGELRGRASKWRRYKLDGGAAAEVLEDAAAEIDLLTAELAVRDRALESMGLALASEYGVLNATEYEQRVIVADYVCIHTQTARAELAREQEEQG